MRAPLTRLSQPIRKRNTRSGSASRLWPLGRWSSCRPPIGGGGPLGDTFGGRCSTAGTFGGCGPLDDTFGGRCSTAGTFGGCGPLDDTFGGRSTTAGTFGGCGPLDDTFGSRSTTAGGSTRRRCLGRLLLASGRSRYLLAHASATSVSVAGCRSPAVHYHDCGPASSRHRS